ncbi:MAG: 3-dehydroquinate synthase II [Proteobacteria bacterium]|nr:3-dehydroquinate synthase II [Pseudomonadota bacterium]
MKTIWVRVDPWDKKLVTTALEGGADAVMAPEGYAEKVRALGRVPVIAKDGDLVPERDVFFVTVKGQEDEAEVLAKAAQGPVVVDTPDWSIIPLENLVARKARVVHRVSSLEDARTAAGVLEHGVWGVLVETTDAKTLKGILTELKSAGSRTPLVEASITRIKPVGMGDRVCVDTCTSMGTGEGMLVGNSASALFLVHAESLENPYVAARPFRVNAGAVHAYTRTPDGRTRYLSELSAGDEVLVTDHEGKTSTAVVGRLKIEKRPLLLVVAETGDGRRITTILQNAETIRLVRPDGSAASVVGLAPGDRVLVALEEGGRHFGYKIEETITEK